MGSVENILRPIKVELKYGLLVREDGEFITPRTGANSMEVEFVNDPFKGLYWVSTYIKPVGESPGVAMPIASLEYYDGVYQLIDEMGIRFTLVTYSGPNKAA